MMHGSRPYSMAQLIIPHCPHFPRDHFVERGTLHKSLINDQKVSEAKLIPRELYPEAVHFYLYNALFKEHKVMQDSADLRQLVLKNFDTEIIAPGLPAGHVRKADET